MARAEGYVCYTMSFDYGQRHRAELDAAARVAGDLGAVEHKVIGLNLNGIGGSALTDSSIAVPESPSEGIPVTYVPARNTVFLSLAPAGLRSRRAGYLHRRQCRGLLGLPGLPSRVCRVVRAHGQSRYQGRCGRAGLHDQAPLQNLSKSDIVKAGTALGLITR